MSRGEVVELCQGWACRHRCARRAASLGDPAQVQKEMGCRYTLLRSSLPRFLSWLEMYPIIVAPAGAVGRGLREQRNREVERIQRSTRTTETESGATTDLGRSSPTVLGARNECWFGPNFGGCQGWRCLPTLSSFSTKSPPSLPPTCRASCPRAIPSPDVPH